MTAQQKSTASAVDFYFDIKAERSFTLRLVSKVKPSKTEPLQLERLSTELLARRWYQREIDDIRSNSTGDGYVKRNAERGHDNTIALCGGPRDYNHYCEMMEEASNNGVLPSVFLQEYYDVLHNNLNDIVWPRLKEMFMKHRENVDSFFSLVDSCDKPQEKADFLFSHHQWLCMVEMTKYHFESAQLRYNSVARILARTEKEIANLKAVGL